MKVSWINPRFNAMPSGNFSGSNITVNSSLTQVSQAIGTLPGLDESGRRQLSDLLAELADALAQTPPERAQEAAAVAALTADLVDKARAAPPNPPLLRISAEGVLKAAKSLAETAAPVLKILEQANADRSLQLTAKSNFTYNLLFSDDGKHFRVYVMLQPILPDPFNPKTREGMIQGAAPVASAAARNRRRVVRRG